MTNFGVIKQIYESSAPFVYCMCETRERAESIAKRATSEIVTKNTRYWVEPIKDNALIGDYLENVKVI